MAVLSRSDPVDLALLILWILGIKTSGNLWHESYKNKNCSTGYQNTSVHNDDHYLT
jgi:hypothetical protein